MPEDVKKDLHEVDEAIGDVATLEAFVLAAGKLLGANFEKVDGGYIFKKLNMDDWMASALGQGDKIHISFQSPTPHGFRYIGRNHRFVEQLCHRVIANSFDKERKEKSSKGICIPNRCCSYTNHLNSVPCAKCNS